MEEPTGKTLRQAVLDFGAAYIEENEARKCIHQLLQTIKALHYRKIKHSFINLDSIFTRSSLGGLEIKLGKFDKAKTIKANEKRARSDIALLGQAQ